MINISNIINSNRLFCIGNSHVHQFSGFPHGQLQYNVTKDMLVVNLGPLLAYNFATKHISKVYDTINRFSFNIRKDILLLNFGEIDCRWYILSHSDLQKRNWQDVTRECAWRYFNTMLNLSRNISGIKIIVWGVSPLTRMGHNPDMGAPIFGDPKPREDVVKLFNDELYKLCLITKTIKFASIYNNLIDEDGLSKSDFFDLNDYIHYNHDKIQAYVNNELYRVIGEFS